MLGAHRSTVYYRWHSVRLGPVDRPTSTPSYRFFRLLFGSVQAWRPAFRSQGSQQRNPTPRSRRTNAQVPWARSHGTSPASILRPRPAVGRGFRGGSALTTNVRARPSGRGGPHLIDFHLSTEVAKERIRERLRVSRPRAGVIRHPGSARTQIVRPSTHRDPAGSLEPRRLDECVAEDLGRALSATEGVDPWTGDRPRPATGAIDPVRDAGARRLKGQ